MKLGNYINRVVGTNKAIFCKITIEKGFDSDQFLKLCNLQIPKERLIVAWSLIIDKIDEEYREEKEILFLPDPVLDFLIENDICLIDLAHLKLPIKYLRKIYDKDNTCWEAIKTMESII